MQRHQNEIDMTFLLIAGVCGCVGSIGLIAGLVNLVDARIDCESAIRLINHSIFELGMVLLAFHGRALNRRDGDED